MDPKNTAEQAENTDDDDAAQPGEGDGAAEAGDAADDGHGPEEGDVDQGDGSEEGEPGEDAEEVAEEAAEAEPPVQPKRSLSDLHREEKKARKAAEQRAAQREQEAAEARREAAEERRRREEAERRATERRQAETEAQEQAKIDLMSESEKLAYYRQKDREAHTQEMNGVKFQIWDSSDRADFRQLCRDDPAVARVKDKVEAEYQRLLASGRPVSREVLANLEIGKSYREERLKSAGKQRQRAEAGVRRETTRPPRTASGVSAERRQRGGGPSDPRAAREARLKDVIL